MVVYGCCRSFCSSRKQLILHGWVPPIFQAIDILQQYSLSYRRAYILASHTFLTTSITTADSGRRWVFLRRLPKSRRRLRERKRTKVSVGMGIQALFLPILSFWLCSSSLLPPATEGHLGILKAKLAKYRTQLMEPPKGASSKVWWATIRVPLQRYQGVTLFIY